jgi:hypothetical protein
MPGKTPLVGWLKGFMVPELLDIPVSKAVAGSSSKAAYQFS